MPKTLLDATTAQAASAPVTVIPAIAGAASLPAHLTAPGLAGSETADVQIQTASGGWVDYYVDGTQQQITATNTGVVIYAPGIYRANKSATAAAVPVELSTPANP